MFNSIRKLSSQGDTIVEVMIALTVLMVVLGGGYSIATRSLNGVQIAKERSEATKIAEGQLEAINWKVQNVGNVVELYNAGYIGAVGGNWDSIGLSTTPPSKSFCVNTSNLVATSNDDLNIPPTIDPDTFEDECKQGTNGNGRYHIAVTTELKLLGFNADASADKKQLTYKVLVLWERSGGGPTEKVEIQDRYVAE